MPRLAALVLFAAVTGQAAAGATNLDGQGIQDPAETVNQGGPPADASWLPPPELVVIAEKTPVELPNGQMLTLFDHKVGHNRIRYEVDGIEYKPSVGTTVALPGPSFAVLVTCTQWRLPKKHFGRDSAEFEIECIPRPALQAPADTLPHSLAPLTPRRPSESDDIAPSVPPASAAPPRRPAEAPAPYRTQIPAEARELPAPESLILAEKRPFQLPNGELLVLRDHKVGHNQVRYEVEGIEYKPAVGETLVFPGEGFSVHVTCTCWKLLKKHYGEDSAEFLIEAFPAP